MDDDKIIAFCQNLCENLCDQLTVIKGFIELNEDKDKGKGQIQFSTELRREIEEMITSIRASIDEIKTWNN